LQEVQLASTARRPIAPVIVSATAPSTDLRYYIGVRHQIAWADAHATARALTATFSPAPARAGVGGGVTLHTAKPSSDPRLIPGSVWRDAIPGLPESAYPEMVTIPPGKFLMGAPAGEEGSSDAERPQHEVRIDYAFALGKHELMVDEFAAFIAETKHDTGASAYV
jgi:formylglycine-generating enzyme required for sulfatase activity